LEPIVWAIDDWNRNYKLAVLFECRVGRGRLLVSSFGVEDSESNPVLRQLRRSLLSYIGSARFQPLTTVTREQLRGLFFDTRKMSKLGAVANAESRAPNSVANVIDGDPNTFWLAGGPGAGKRPVELIISFPSAVAISGLVLMPRQNHREHEGDIRQFLVSISNDGNEWQEIKRGELLSTFEPQKIDFSARVMVQHIKLTALSGFGSDEATALAELAVIYEGPNLIEADSGSLKYERSKSASPDIDENSIDTDRERKSPKPKPKKKS
jgi:hypothetical protein